MPDCEFSHTRYLAKIIPLSNIPNSFIDLNISWEPMPGPLLAAENIALSKTDRSLCSAGAYVLFTDPEGIDQGGLGWSGSPTRNQGSGLAAQKESIR